MNDKPAKKEKAPKQPGRWKRRLIVLGLVLLAIGVIGRVIIVIALPPVMRNVAGRYGLNVGYDRMHLYLMSGDVGFWNLQAAPKEGGEALFVGEYIRANVSALNLLRGRLVVWRAEVDGSELLLERDEKGKIPLLERFTTTHTEQPAAETKQTSSIDLAPPLRIDALRLSAARAHVKDRAVSPPMESQLELTLRLSDFGHETLPARLVIDVALDPILDSLRIEGQANDQRNGLDGKFHVTMRGLHPPAAAPYLAQLGLRPAGDTVNVLAQASLNLTPITPPDPQNKSAPPSPLKGSIKLENIVAIVDGKLAAGLKQMSIDIDSFDETHAKIGKVFVTGAGANLERTANGGIRAAGFELAPELATATTEEPAKTSRPFKWELAQLDISDVKATFRDNAITPQVNLALALNRFTIKDLVDDPARRDVPATIDGEITLPGVIRAAKISGSATPFAADKQAKITLAAEGIKPDALQPYFDALGIESQLKDATASCVILGHGKVDQSGQLSLQGKVTDVRIVDGGADLLTFGGATIDGLVLDSAHNRVRVDTIELSGPQLSVAKEQSGAVAALGLRIKPPATQPAAKKALEATPTTQPKVALAATSPTTQPAAKPLRVDIGKLAWKDIKVKLEDQSVAPPTAVELADAGVELANLSIDTGPAAAPTTQPGTFKAWLTAPGSAGSVVANGTIAPRPGAISLDAQVNGSKINLAVLAPYLKPLGIEPTLKDGSLELHANVEAAQTDAGLTASAAIDKLRYLEGSEELAGIDGVKVASLVLGDEIRVDSVEVTNPRAWVQREADGSFLAGGTRIRFPLPPQEETSPTIATVGKLEVKGAAIRWTDRAVNPPVDTTARSSVSLRDFVMGKPAEPARLSLAAAVEGILENAEVEGTVSLAPQNLQAHLDVNAQGIRQGALVSYLPPGTSVTLKDGQFRTRLDAEVVGVDGGGNSINAVVSKLDYRDGETPLLRFDSAKLAVTRMDMPKVLAIDEISLAGFETSAALNADGTTQLLGIALAKAAQAAPPANEPQAAPATRPAAASAPTSQPTGAADVAKLAAAVKKQLPDVTVKKLDLHVKNVTVTTPNATPLALAEWRVTNRKPIEMLGPDPAARPPVEIDVAGRIDPLAEAVKVGVVTAPFAQRPSLAVDLDVSGIKGDGALAFAPPAMKEQIDPAGLTQGTFRSHFETTLKLDRRSLADFELVKGFDADLTLKEVAFRAEPNGPVLLGVDEVRSEGIRAEPHAGVYHAKSIEVTKPIAHAYRDAEGLHALGLTIKLPEKKADEAPADKEKEKEKPEAPPAAAVESPATQPVQGEIRIDRFLVSGIDASVEDRTVQPPLKLPITGLDVDVRDFTTRALVEDKPIKFSLIANSGKVLVPRRNANGQYDDRDLFSQVVASGKIALYPKPKGWAKGAVNGFELGSLESAMKPYGIDLHAGVFDANTELRFPGDGSMDTKSRFIFTDMKLAEPPNGPIQRAMKLSAPLDVVLALLQDPSGGITLPIGVSMKDGELKGVGGAAVGAVASVAATAVASAPIKAANALTGLVGLGPKKKSRAPEAPIVLEFAAADPGLSPDAQSQLSALIERMRRDKNLQVTVAHELGAADVTRAAVLANPSPATAAALANRLRERKNELVALRGQLSEDARVQLASHVEPTPTLQRLRGVSRELASHEEALDRLYDLLRPGADRQADRRTRAACIDVGQERLDTVQAALMNAGLEAAKERVQVTRAQFAEDTPSPTGRVLLTVRWVKR